MRRIEAFYDDMLRHDVRPLTLGGDRTLSLPILRAMAKNMAVGTASYRCHADINSHMFGEEIAHGTPFRRAFEEGLLDASNVFQIGLRGAGRGRGF